MPLRRQPPFGYLLIALIAFLVLGPIISELSGPAAGSVVLMASLSGTLLISIFSLQENRSIFLFGIVLAATSVGLTVVDLFIQPGPWLVAFGLVVVLLFLGGATFLATLHLVSPGKISVDRLMGGAAIYLMLGIVWAILYVFLYRYEPDSFNGAINAAAGNEFWDLVYFSFVTMPALGYGDITPVSPLARVLAYMQAVVGQLYIAILIGALVGTYISSRANNDRQEPGNSDP